MSKRSRALLVAAGALALVGHLGLDAFLHDHAASTLAYPNRLQKRAHARASFKSAELCAACHKNIYDEWKRSYLSRAYQAGIGTIELHALSLALRGIDAGERRWCLQCHAPLALTTPEDLAASDPVVREGVTCTVCHAVTEAHPGVDPGVVTLEPLGGMIGPFDDSRSPMHPSRQGARFTGDDSRLCGSCHWSAHPGSKLAIDWTYPEWLEYRELAVRRGESPRSCQDCHMPRSEGQAAQLDHAPRRRIASHAFPGARDEALVREGAALGWELRDEGRNTVLKVSVRNLAGHNLPTGNASWPQLSLTVSFLDGADATELAAFRYHASFQLEDGTETYDTTIGHVAGPNTSLRPFETRVEAVEIPTELARRCAEQPERYALEIRLTYCYIRILDATAPPLAEGSKARTLAVHVSQWLAREETHLGHVARMLADRETYARLARIGELRTVRPIVVRRVIVGR